MSQRPLTMLLTGTLLTGAAVLFGAALPGAGTLSVAEGAASMGTASVDAKAWILVDGGSGAILDSSNARQPLPPASTTKLMTALVAVERLTPGAAIEIGPLAASQEPMRVGMRDGERWLLDDALRALLMVSANDAAYAIAEHAAGSLESFADAMQLTASRLGMRDSVFLDPAGFDDASSFRGGSRVSALDLAIVARNALAVPELAGIVASLEHRFVDPNGRPHRLLNHNKLLRRYPGALGLKTGYTRRAGHTLVAAARRDGRTMIAVVLGSPGTYAAATSLLDRGFASPPGTGTGERLPPVRVRPAHFSEAAAPAAPAPAASVPSRGDRAGRAAAGDQRRNGANPAASPPPSASPLLFLFAATAAILLRRRAVVVCRHRQSADMAGPLVGPEAWLLEQDASRASWRGHIGAS